MTDGICFSVSEIVDFQLQFEKTSHEVFTRNNSYLSDLTSFNAIFDAKEYIMKLKWNILIESFKRYNVAEALLVPLRQIGEVNKQLKYHEGSLQFEENGRHMKATAIFTM